MVLDPRQGCFPQFLCAGLHGILVLDAIQPLTSKTLGKTSCLRVNWPHSGAPAVLAEQPTLMRIVEGRLRAKWLVASNATVKPRQPTAQPHGPKNEVAQWQVPIAGAL